MSPEGLEYSTRQLIPYIGNKRALLPLLGSIFEQLEAEAPIRTFLDPFAGSGSVSRLARTLGWRVMANDAEEYALAINTAWLGVSSLDVASCFRTEGGLAKILDSLNALHPMRQDSRGGSDLVDGYISRHYAPSTTEGADYRRERLFYTRENAVFIDRVRAAIEAIRPRAGCPAGIAAAERALLIGPLLLEAATHANTSGVFKACHKGFGGHGKDALGRITAPMLLEMPMLWPLPGAEVGKLDAGDFCSSRPADLCYLDPPYNQHQYGSNYHLLNTICTWDRFPVSEERRPDGSLASKAGIPPGWKRTKSAFCSRAMASSAFENLLSSIDARILVLSYNSEGLVPVEDLYDLLSRHCDVEMRSSGYVLYRGGRQSDARRLRNRELLFIARRMPERSMHGPSAERKERLNSLEQEVRLSKALGNALDPTALAAHCVDDLFVFASANGVRVELPTYRKLILEKDAMRLCDSLGSDSMRELADLLEPLSLPGNGEACRAAAKLMHEGAADLRLQDLALGWLRKLAHRPYSSQFEELSALLSSCAARQAPRLARLSTGLVELRSLFSARMGK